MNVNEAVVRMKAAGAQNVRATPMPKQSALDGLYQVEIKEGGSWATVIEGVSQQVAQGLISQALNRVICG